MIEPVTRDIEPAVLVLNNRHAEELSWLEPEQLSHLISQAFYARRIGAVEAFLIAFDQDADYDSPNFLWFKSRYARFVYVDRIAVAETARGQGHARRVRRRDHGLLPDQGRSRSRLAGAGSLADDGE